MSKEKNPFDEDFLEDTKPEPNFWSHITADVRYNKNLTANEKLLFSEITALTNAKGYCWATNKYFARLYDVAPETISRWVKNLEKEKMIGVVIHITKEGSRRFIRTLGGVNLNATPPSQKNHTGMTETSGGYDANVKHNNTINTTANTNIKIGSAGFLDITAIINIEEYQTIYSAVIAKRKNKQITPDEFLAVLNDRYGVYEFTDKNHFINALNRCMRELEANKKKATRRDNFNPPQTGMVY